MSSTLSDSASTFHKRHLHEFSDVSVALSNAVDEVVHRNTIYPINLSSEALPSSFSSFLFNANPVYLRIQEIMTSVEDRIEAENRATVRSMLDLAITKIKRRGRKKEPGFVLRFLDHTDNLSRSISSRLLDQAITKVERRTKRDNHCSSVLAGGEAERRHRAA